MSIATLASAPIACTMSFRTALAVRNLICHDAGSIRGGPENADSSTAEAISERQVYKGLGGTSELDPFPLVSLRVEKN